ncbi:MAG: hypothetical protein M3R06_09190 [Chloroflexota bacterium]|nr:hypothetical protein [Chloroflexota bacterium]
MIDPLNTRDSTLEATSLTVEDLRQAVAVCRATLDAAVGRDWSVLARDLAWSCHRTLDHIADALSFYSTHLAILATARRVPLRNGDPTRLPAELLGVVETAAAVLAAVVTAAPAGARAFHPAGMADVTGFLAMGCTEILVHTHDIAHGLDLPFRAPDELCRKILTRLFPWAPPDTDPWEALLWACGRAPLGDIPRLDPNWYWHCAPLTEWDGTRTVRATPPNWT